MSKELKPCPFCGNPPRKHISEDCYFFILCDKCGCHVAKRSPDAAEKHWNTRPIEDAQAARIAELEAAIQRCCRNCWADKATVAAQCRDCGLKTALKGE